jgi:hypothetical protein
VKLVWFGVSDTVAVTVIGLNVSLVETSNRYTSAPAGPVRTELATVNVGHPVVVTPFAGATGVGAPITIVGADGVVGVVVDG